MDSYDKDDNQNGGSESQSGRDDSTYVPQRDSSSDQVRTGSEEHIIRKQK